MKYLARLLLPVLLATSALPLQAQAPAPAAAANTPQATVAAMNQAMERGDWKAAAAQFDPQALKDFRAMLMPVIDAAPAAQRETMVKTMFDIGSLDELKRASDGDFFASYMGGILSLAGGKLVSNDIIGEVAEGADVRHVVTRSRVAAQGIEMTKMDVVSLRRTPQGWRVQLKGDMTGMAELMKRRLQGDGGKGAD